MNLHTCLRSSPTGSRNFSHYWRKPSPHHDAASAMAYCVDVFRVLVHHRTKRLTFDWSDHKKLLPHVCCVSYVASDKLQTGFILTKIWHKGQIYFKLHHNFLPDLSAWVLCLVGSLISLKNLWGQKRNSCINTEIKSHTGGILMWLMRVEITPPLCSILYRCLFCSFNFSTLILGLALILAGILC